MSTVLYETKAVYDSWMKLILSVPVLIIVIEALLLARESMEDMLIMGATILFILVIYWLILPRRYLIYDDRVSILLGWPCSMNVAFSTIKKAGSPKGVVFGMNLGGSSKNAVTINRKKRMNITISPAEPQIFIDTLEKALQDWRMYYDKTG